MGAERVRALLDDAARGQAVIYINTVNLIEINYCFYRALGKEKSNLILEQVYALPINFIDTIDDIIFTETSRIKAHYAIPLGDSIGLATAIKLDGTFVTAIVLDFPCLKLSFLLS